MEIIKAKLNVYMANLYCENRCSPVLIFPKIILLKVLFRVMIVVVWTIRPAGGKSIIIIILCQLILRASNYETI